MSMFPVNLDISGKMAIIVGGGRVAERKCRSLLDADAAVTVIAPVATPALAELALQGRIAHLSRPYSPGFMAGSVLVFVATDDRQVNRAAADEAKRLGIPVCCADAPSEGDFTTPSAIRRGNLLITISTGGRCPALAKRIREDLEECYGPEYAEIVELCGTIREKLLTEQRESAYNNQLFNELFDRYLPRRADSASTGERDRLLRDLAGPAPLPGHLADDIEESP